MFLLGHDTLSPTQQHMLFKSQRERFSKNLTKTNIYVTEEDIVNTEFFQKSAVKAVLTILH